MFNIRNYISDTSFQMNVYNNYIDIINYKKILNMNNDKIVLDIGNNKLIIRGDKLVVKKLLESEMVITGEIIAIEYSNE